MTIVTRSVQIRINAPLQDTFSYVSNLKTHPEWSDGKLIIEETSPGPISNGKEYHSKGEAGFEKERPNKVIINLLEPPTQFGFISTDPTFGDVTHVFTFTQQNNEILIDRTITINVNPLMAFVYRIFIYPILGQPQLLRTFSNLKSKLEENRQ